MDLRPWNPAKGVDGLDGAGGHKKFTAILAAERLLSWPHTGFNVHGGRFGLYSRRRVSGSMSAAEESREYF
jgi:hypothetical protein